MDSERRPRVYRDIIDALVVACRQGQGQIGSGRALAGVWNPHVDASLAPDQHAINLLLAGLSSADRETVARMLDQEFVCGVFATLKVLETYGIAPFDEGYEGGPANDFIGRLAGDWKWPEDAG